jgi:hypothetical protein
VRDVCCSFVTALAPLADANLLVAGSLVLAASALQCTGENAEDAKLCSACGQKKSEQKAICGVCRQSTVIPSSNFSDGLSHTVKTASRSSRKVYLDLANKPFITCPKCQHHVEIADKSKITAEPSAAPAAGGSAASTGVATQEGGVVAPGGAGMQVEGTYNVVACILLFSISC